MIAEEDRQRVESLIAQIEAAWPQVELLTELASAPDEAARVEITQRYVVVANEILARGGSRCRFALSMAADEDTTAVPEPSISGA